MAPGTPYRGPVEVNLDKTMREVLDDAPRLLEARMQFGRLIEEATDRCDSINTMCSDQRRETKEVLTKLVADALQNATAELAEAAALNSEMKALLDHACDERDAYIATGIAEYDGAQAARRGVSIEDCPYGPNKPDGFRDSTLMGMWQKGHDLVTRAKRIEQLEAKVAELSRRQGVPGPPNTPKGGNIREGIA
jgi:hypothetical protein